MKKISIFFSHLILFLLIILPFQVSSNEDITSKSTYSARYDKLFDEIKAADNMDITPEIYFKRAGMKILSGTANLATGWMELPKVTILCAQQRTDWLCNNILEGFWLGAMLSIIRTNNGIGDLITFWYPTPPGANKLTGKGIDPLFIWDDFSQETIMLGSNK